MILCFATAAVLVGHGVLAWPLVRRLWHWRRPRLGDAACPPAAVILCLRGADPFLAATLRALLDQDYPCYELWVVVDGRRDPAWGLAETAVRASGATNVTITALTERRSTCSLTCSGFVQAVTPLLHTHEVVVSVDADVVPHRTWLRELVAPLADPRVGGATGNRWYWPARFTWGALVRYFWDAPAVAQMVCYGIPWAGSLALRSEVVRQCGLLDLWGHALVHDVPLFQALRRYGWRVEFVPSVLMVNRETIPLTDFFVWVQRQLLLPRLYHPRWWAIVGHALAVTLLPGALLATLLVGGMLHAGDVLAWAGASLAGYMIGSLVELACIEWLVRRLVRGRGEQPVWGTWAMALAALPAFLLTHLVYPAALLGAVCRRTISWRGITYRIDGPWQIHRLNDDPHPDAGEGRDDLTSL